MVGVVAAVAIAVAAPYLAPLALGALGIAATATAIAVATAVITIGLSLAVSFAFRALGVGTPSAKNQVGPPQVFRQTISNSFNVYGKRRCGGLLVFFHGKQDTGGAHFRYFVVAVAGHQCKDLVSWMLNDEVVTVDGTGMVTSGKYANAAWLWFYRGTPTDIADPTFIAECDGKWTTAHQGKGVAKLYAKFKLTDAVVQAGMPNMTAIIEGRDEILDPRTGTTGYTRNATLVFYDFKRMPREEGGYGAYDDEIPDDSWVSAQANVCDEVVNGAPRYAIDAVIQTGASPGEIRDVLVVSQAGTYTFSGGKHLMRPGYWVPVSATLLEDDLAGAIQVSPFMAADSAANELQGTYISPDANYTAAPLTTWDAPGLTDIKQADIDLAFVTNKDQGDRILQIMGKRAQCEKTLTWPENIVGLQRRAMDTVQVDKADYGLSNYAWTIMSWQFAADFGAVMNMREENAEIYGDPAPVAPAAPPAISDGTAIDSQMSAILRASYANGLDLTGHNDGGGVAHADYTSFTLEYAAPTPVVVTVPSGSIGGLVYGGTTYWAYADVASIGDAAPTVGLTDVKDDAFNSAAHPMRVFLGRKIDTPSGGGSTSSSVDPGGGYAYTP